MLKNIWSACSSVDRLQSSQINTLPSTQCPPLLSVPNRPVVSFFLSPVTKCSFIHRALMMEIWYFGEWGKNENHNVSILVRWINGFPNLSFPLGFPWTTTLQRSERLTSVWSISRMKKQTNYWAGIENFCLK